MEGQGGRVDEEEGWMRRKERRGERSDEESEKKINNEKVARGRIINPRGLVLSIAFFLDNENSNSVGLNFAPIG